jgi:hypothetical protein
VLKKLAEYNYALKKCEHRAIGDYSIETFFPRSIGRGGRGQGPHYILHEAYLCKSYDRVGTDRGGDRDLLAAGGVLRRVDLQEPVLRIWT